MNKKKVNHGVMSPYLHSYLRAIARWIVLNHYSFRISSSLTLMIRTKLNSQIIDQISTCQKEKKVSSTNRINMNELNYYKE